MDFGSGIVYWGTLEKRRDGAVRGGWAIRTFILTENALHYYRRMSDQDLLGEERGYVGGPVATDK